MSRVPASARRVASRAREVVATTRETQVSFLAASIAYYMLVSLFPLGLLALVVATTLGGDAFATRVVRSLGVVLSPAAEGVLRTALTEGAGRGGATVLGLVVLLWSGLRVFRGLDVAFSLVYGSEEPEGLVAQVADALVALAGITVAIVSLAVVNALVVFSGLQLAGVVGTVALVGTLAVAFLPLYFVFPDAALSVREAVPGAVVAAVGWTLLGAGFSVYASVARGSELYGVVGGVLLLVTWFYFASVALLVGAAVNAVLSDRQVQQAAERREVTMAGDRATPPPDGREEAGEERGDADSVAQVRADLEAFREDVEERTLHREAVKSDLRAYVRRRLRRGHARGWGPYLVLLYGTAMTLGAFHSLSGPWAILAMVVVWLSTLGLYVLMLLVGAGLEVAGVPGRLLDRLR